MPIPDKWKSKVKKGSKYRKRTLFSGCQVAALPACGNGLRQHHPGCVNSLKYSLQVHPPRDLPDEDGGHALGAQLLVDAQEVDFYHPLPPAREKEVDWSESERRGWVCSASAQGRGLTCHRYGCLQGWRWWSRPASCWRKLSLRSATVATSLADAKPCKTDKPFKVRVHILATLLINTATSKVIKQQCCLPFKKVWWVIKSEHVLVVLDVVLV